MHNRHAKILREGVGQEGQPQCPRLQQVDLKVAQVQILVHQADLPHVANVAQFKDLHSTCTVRQRTLLRVRPCRWVLAHHMLLLLLKGGVQRVDILPQQGNLQKMRKVKIAHPSDIIS